MGFWLKCASVGADSLAHFERLPIPDICHERHEYIRVNFFGRCKFLQIERKKMAFSTDFTRKSGVFFTDLMRKIGVFLCKFHSPKILLM